MKNIKYILYFIFLFSCKEKAQNISNQNEASHLIINKLWCGDSIISESNFINQVNISCKINDNFFDRSEKQIDQDNNKCVLSKIKFDYEKFDNLKGEVIIGQNDKFNLYIKKTNPKNKNNADSYVEVTLFSKSDNQNIDSLVIYKSVNYSEALSADTQYFYIDKNKIYLLDITENENGAKIESCKEYNIDEKTGRISLVENNHNKSVPKKENILAKWEGVYWISPYEKSSDKIGNYYINIFENELQFGFSGDDDFVMKIIPVEKDNKLYLYDKSEYSENMTLKDAKAILTKINSKYYIKSPLIKLQGNDLKETTDGYSINWAKSADDISDTP